MACIAQSGIIPHPLEIKQTSNQVSCNPQAILYDHEDLRDEAIFLSQRLADIHKVAVGSVIQTPTRQHVPEGPNITLHKFLSDTLLPDGIYWLKADAQGCQISATTDQGIFYGIQSLLQLVQKNGDVLMLRETEINGDFPKFAYRGMHLDVSRHFFPVAFIKKYIDLLALHKMNRFHWHLTDDQGWRIEIKRYPKLTEIGGFRTGSMIGHYRDQTFDDLRYGGFYTQEEIREVVAYASARHIVVVPEIEMPGHALAALAAYPQFSCTGKPLEVGKAWGVFDDVFCPKEETFEFLQHILDEVVSLFPGEYVHIGGDECPKTRWKACSNCQKRMASEGLKDEHELQSYFIQRIEKYLNAKGKKIIGWDEILEGGLAPNATVMSWRGTEGGIAAANLNHGVIMTPGSHCYFDHYQGKEETERLAIGGFTPLEKVLAFNPIPASLDANKAKYILGAQGNVWTEYMSTSEHVEYMVIPRISALAEVLWYGPEKTDYIEFKRRLSKMLVILNSLGYSYRKPD